MSLFGRAWRYIPLPPTEPQLIGDKAVTAPLGFGLSGYLTGRTLCLRGKCLAGLTLSRRVKRLVRAHFDGICGLDSNLRDPPAASSSLLLARARRGRAATVSCQRIAAVAKSANAVKVSPYEFLEP